MILIFLIKAYAYHGNRLTQRREQIAQERTVVRPKLIFNEDHIISIIVQLEFGGIAFTIVVAIILSLLRVFRQTLEGVRIGPCLRMGRVCGCFG